MNKLTTENPISNREIMITNQMDNQKFDQDVAIWAKPLSRTDNLDVDYFSIVHNELGETPEGNYQFQRYRSVYNQMVMPTVLGKIFPTGLIGLFCLLMVMLLVSTDDSRIFNASSTIMQDILLPLFKGKLNNKTHILLLRLLTVGVALFFLMVALLFSQLDYINMFTTIMTSLWLGGAGPIMIFGLYSRFGNLTGAWCAIIFGSGTSLCGLILQRTWALSVYPFLNEMGWVEPLNNFLISVSSPFNPYIMWKMDAVKFPINSFEIYFIAMILSVGGYIIGSYLTYKPFNLDKLLHRNEYADEHSIPFIREQWTLRNMFTKIIGITSDYTRGDKIIAYSVFGYCIVYMFGIAFLGVIIANLIYPWPKEWWVINFFITSLLMPSIIAIISTVWMFIGGLTDSIKLFKDLESRETNFDDNGQILDNIGKGDK